MPARRDGHAARVDGPLHLPAERARPRAHRRRRARRLEARLRPRHPARPRRRPAGCSPTTSRTNDIPGMHERERGYWRDVGTIDAYWQASAGPRLGHARVQPLQPGVADLLRVLSRSPPAKFVFADREQNRIGIATDSMVSEGCIISGGRVDRSILGPRVRVNSFSRRRRVDPLRRRRGRPPRAHPPRDRRQGRAYPAGHEDRLRPDAGPPALHRERGRGRRRAEGREARVRPARTPTPR